MNQDQQGHCSPPPEATTSPRKGSNSSDAAVYDAALVPVINLLEEVRQYEQRQSESLVDTETEGFAAKVVDVESIEAQLRQVGRFEILSKLGQGGFGIVFRAKDSLLEREVALKIPRFESVLSREARQRFAREARAAATLNHPNIVSVYETGSDRGLDYLVCEFVDGRDLANELEQTGHAMGAQSAAELTLALAEATEHAHRRGILHRDIKPSNILIDNETRLPRISDFGMASLLNEAQSQTQTGTAVGTPAYMSPEQAVGNKTLIGPATDVYGLGAVLYHLLSGRPPFQAATAVDTIRAVCDNEPAPLNRGHASIPRDLAAICCKCLEKTPSLRYSSAHLLAEDLRRFLENRPVSARPASTTRKLLRWANRNRALAVSSSALVFSLVAGSSLLTYQFLSALDVNDQLVESNNRLKKIVTAEQQSRRVAEDNYRVSAQLSEFLVRLFESSRPLKEGKDVTVASRLKQAYEDLKSDQQVEPEILSTLLYSIGSSLRELGEPDLALEVLLSSESAIASSTAVNPGRIIRVRSALGQTYSDLSRFEDAVAILQPNRLAAIEHLGVHADSTHIATNNLAIALTKLGQANQAVELLEPVLAYEREHPDRYGESLATTLNNYAFSLRNVGRLDEAATHFEQSAAECDRYLGPDSFNRLLCEINLAEIYLLQKLPDKASPLAMHAAIELRKQMGPTHAETMKAENLLVGCYFVSGDFVRAEEVLRRLVEVSENTLGPNHENTLAFKHNLAGTLSRTGRDAEALPLFQEVWDVYQANGHQRLAAARRCLTNLAKACWTTGDLNTAKKYYRELIQLTAESENPRIDILAGVTKNLATIESDQEDYSESVTIVRGFLDSHQDGTSLFQRLELLRLELDSLQALGQNELFRNRLAEFQSAIEAAKTELDVEQVNQLTEGLEPIRF